MRALLLALLSYGCANTASECGRPVAQQVSSYDRVIIAEVLSVGPSHPGPVDTHLPSLLVTTIDLRPVEVVRGTSENLPLKADVATFPMMRGCRPDISAIPRSGERLVVYERGHNIYVRPFSWALQFDDELRAYLAAQSRRAR